MEVVRVDIGEWVSSLGLLVSLDICDLPCIPEASDLPIHKPCPFKLLQKKEKIIKTNENCRDQMHGNALKNLL